jgi:hypothetical protein
VVAISDDRVNPAQLIPVLLDELCRPGQHLNEHVKVDDSPLHILPS